MPQTPWEVTIIFNGCDRISPSSHYFKIILQSCFILNFLCIHNPKLEEILKKKRNPAVKDIYYSRFFLL